MKRIAFVTTFCPHYREQTFAMLSRHHQVDFYFFSKGDEWYWQHEHGLRTGDFRHQYLWGFRVAGTRITPSLPTKLWQGRYDAYIKCINGRFALPVTYLIARIRRRPFILWTGVWTRIRTPAHRLAFPLTRFIYRHADAVVAYGEHVKRYLVSEGVDAKRVFVAPHAVDNPSYSRPVPAEELHDLRRRLGIAAEKQVVLFLGRFEQVKGLIYLIQAFASLHRRDAVLLLAGSGSERSRLESVARNLALDGSIVITGHVAPDRSLPYYAISTLCVLPSVTLPAVKEPWGLVVNEAMNQGVPVITSDAVGAAAGCLVQDGINGFVVPERDAAALAGRICAVLDDPVLHSRLSAGARATIASWDNAAMVAGFRAAIDSVTAS